MKACICCGEKKSLDMFHRHKAMADGRLNKCAKCVVAYASAWAKEKGPAYRRKIYAKRIETGKVSRSRIVKIDGVLVGQDPAKRLVSSLKYFYKRRAKVAFATDELTEFAFSEAIELCQMRKLATGFQWDLDHIVPLHHKSACGLHVAANFQTVPHQWNCKKSNKHMDRYFGNQSISIQEMNY